MSSLKILLVEDEPMWQQAVPALLATTGRYEVVATADCYEDALSAWREHQPDIILLDWNIKGAETGLDVGEALLNEGVPAERMVVISGSDESVIPKNPFAYVPKQRISTTLIESLNDIEVPMSA